jgi:hypothetical protein
VVGVWIVWGANRMVYGFWPQFCGIIPVCVRFVLGLV